MTTPSIPSKQTIPHTTTPHTQPPSSAPPEPVLTLEASTPPRFPAESQQRFEAYQNKPEPPHTKSAVRKNANEVYRLEEATHNEPLVITQTSKAIQALRKLGIDDSTAEKLLPYLPELKQWSEPKVPAPPTPQNLLPSMFQPPVPIDPKTGQSIDIDRLKLELAALGMANALKTFSSMNIELDDTKMRQLASLARAGLLDGLANPNLSKLLSPEQSGALILQMLQNPAKAKQISALLRSQAVNTPEEQEQFKKNILPQLAKLLSSNSAPPVQNNPDLAKMKEAGLDTPEKFFKDQKIRDFFTKTLKIPPETLQTLSKTLSATKDGLEGLISLYRAYHAGKTGSVAGLRQALGHMLCATGSIAALNPKQNPLAKVLAKGIEKVGTALMGPSFGKLLQFADKAGTTPNVMKILGNLVLGNLREAVKEVSDMAKTIAFSSDLSVNEKMLTAQCLLESFARLLPDSVKKNLLKRAAMGKIPLLSLALAAYDGVSAGASALKCRAGNQASCGDALRQGISATGAAMGSLPGAGTVGSVVVDVTLLFWEIQKHGGTLQKLLKDPSKLIDSLFGLPPSPSRTPSPPVAPPPTPHTRS